MLSHELRVSQLAHPNLDIEALRVVMPGGSRTTQRSADAAHADSLLEEVPDAVMADAADLATALLMEAGADSQNLARRAPECLLEALYNCAAAMAPEVSPGQVTRIQVIARRRVRPKVAGLIAIPAGQGLFHTALVLAHNPLGTAHGVFVGRRRPAERSSTL